MTNDMIYKSYLQFIDSTLEFAEVIERDFTGRRKTKVKTYRVKVGEYQKGETPDDMGKLLSLSDLSKVDQGDKTYFTVGNYKNIPEANDRAKQLTQQGFEDLEILSRSKTGEYQKVGPVDNSSPTKPSSTAPAAVSTPTTVPSTTPTPDETTTESKPEVVEDQVVFRVQLGAFKNKPTDPKYSKLPNLFIVQAGAYYRYMSGSFNNFSDAATHKVKMVVEGYKGAFVVAYKNGKRVSLKSVGVNPISSDPLIGK